MKKTIIVLIVTVLVLTLAIINGCDSPVDDAEAPDQVNNNGGITIEEPADEIELPEGLPVYPGATFISHSEGEMEDEEVYEFQTTGSPEDVANFYVSAFEAEGYEDFFYMSDSEMAEVQVQRKGYLVTVIADAVNGTTNIALRIRPFE